MYVLYASYLIEDLSGGLVAAHVLRPEQLLDELHIYGTQRAMYTYVQ